MKSTYKLDPGSDRFRVCPECATSHMVSHRTRLFCSDKCADEFHNRKKRNTKETKLTGTSDNSKTLSHVTKQATDPQAEHPPSLEKNIEILRKLSVDTVKGTEYHLENLLNLGLAFNFYTGRGKLFNIDPKMNCHFLQIGQFRLYRTNYSKFLIYAEN